MDSIEGLRESAGGTASIELECASIPDDLGVEAIDGVANVTVDESTITAHCTDPAAKADVVAHVHDRTSVEDVLSSNTSLEELFNAFTEGGRDGDGTDALGGDGTTALGGDAEPEVST
jgi:ABC-2 type transport system ATP-binding protein